MIRARSPIVRLGIQAATPFAIIVGAYLLFAGHNNPGGGFAAGLVFGTVIALRTVAGLQDPASGLGLVSIGVAIVAGVAMAPTIWGDDLLDQLVVSADVPVLGVVKSGSALPFDIGVTIIVVGLVVAALDGFGAAAMTADGTTGERNGRSR